MGAVQFSKTVVTLAPGINGLHFYQDFVPYVVRVAKLLLSKTESVHPMSLKEGEPQLTMTSIFSLEDLAPFFAAICESVTKQQTKGQSKRKPLRSFTRSVNLKMFFWRL